jgi:MFS family permease
MLGCATFATLTLVAGFVKRQIAFCVCRAISGMACALISGSNIGAFLRMCSALINFYRTYISSSDARTGILVENTGPDKLRSIAIGICIAGWPLGNALGFTVAGPLAEKSG